MTDRLLEQMVKWNIIRSEDEELYRFGLEGLWLKLVHYASYLLIAFLFQEMASFLFFFTVFLSLRKSAGGYHAKTRGCCYIFSCAIVICVLTVMKMSSGWAGAEMISVGLILTADMIICMTAPVENKNRLLDEEEKKYFRKRCMKFLAVVNVFFWLLYALGKVTYALPIASAAGCEAMLLLLGKAQKGNNEIETKQKHSITNV